MSFYTYILVDTRKPGRFTYDGCNISFLYEPFYVGKGQGFRYRDTSSRNDHVCNLMNLLGDSSIVVHFSEFEPCLSEDLAFSLEVSLISLIGRRDLGTGPLLNLTDGGEGRIGFVFTDDLRSLISDRTVTAMASPEFRLMLSDRQKVGWERSDSARSVIAESNRTREVSAITRSKYSEFFSSLPRTTTHRQRISESLKRFHEKKCGDSSQVAQ